MLEETAYALLLEKRDNHEIIDINLFVQGAGADALFVAHSMPCKACQIQNTDFTINLFINVVKIYELSVDFIPNEIKHLYG